MAQRFDAIIAGAGPGGSTTAAFLARAGYKVALFDKERFPRDKPCGDAISGKSVRVLDRLGIIDELERQPVAIAGGVRFTSPKGTELVIPFPKTRASPESMKAGRNYNEAGYICRREVYDNVVFRAADRSGAKTFQGTPIAHAVMEDGRATGIVTKDGTRYDADIVIGAGGSLCPVARSVGSYERDPKHWVAAIRVYWKDVADVDDNIEIHFVDGVIPGYFWIFPLDNGMANIGIGMREDFVKSNGKHDLKRLLDECIHKNPLFAERFKGATEVAGTQRGWILPLASKRRRIHGDGWVTVGDAAGLIDPFSGEGIGNAMLSGMIASETIDAALQDGGATADRLSPYPERLWAEIGDEIERSYKMQRLGRYKWLLNLVINRAARSEYLQQRLSEMLADRDDKELVKPSFYVRLLFN